MARLVFDSRNNQMLPSKGISWNTVLTGMKELNGSSNSYGNLTTDVSWYAASGKKNNIVIANRLGTGAIIGKPAFFPVIGPGWRIKYAWLPYKSFYRRIIFYYNLELRLKLLDFNSYILPGTVGLIGFNDIGRVWVSGERLNQWHDSFGGWLYIIPARLVLIQAVLGYSKEGRLPYISIGFRF